MPLPTIGSRGCITLASPFDTLVIPNRQYRVLSIRKIEDFNISGDNVFEEIYQPAGLTSVQYQTDIDNGVSIVTFVGDGEEILHIPDNYIISYPVNNGIYYQSKAVVFDLGPLPETYDMSAVLTQAQNLIQNIVGVNVEGRIINTSAKMKVSYDEHDSFTALRDGNLGVNRTWYQRYNELLSTVGNLNAVIADLECSIMNGCCNHDCSNLGNLAPVQDTKLEYCYGGTKTYENSADLFVEQHTTGTPVDPGPVWNPTLPDDVIPTDPELFYTENGICDFGYAEGLFFSNQP